MAAPKVLPLRELPAVSWSDWRNVEMVRTALDELERGVFDAAAQVVDAMGRDDRIKGCSFMRTYALSGVPMTLGPRGDKRQSSMVARDATEAWQTIVPNPAAAALQKWGLFCGAGLAELIWERGISRWTPTVKVWHPRYLMWRDSESAWYVTTATGPVKVEPGNGQWVLYTPFGAQRAWMEGLVRSLAVPWLVHQWAWRDWARASEVYGTPTRKAVTPATADKQDAERFIAEVANIGAEATIRTPRDTEEQRFDLELLEAQHDFSGAFERLLLRAEVAIAVGLLGQNLTTEVQGGSYAAAEVHKYIRNDLLRSDGETFGACIRDQVLAPWAQANFGAKDLAPDVFFQTVLPEDKKARGEAMKAVGEGIGALKDIGAKPDVDEILLEHGVPTTGKAEDLLGDDEEEPDTGVDPIGDQEDDEAPAPGIAPEPNQRRAEASIAALAAEASSLESAIEGQLYVDDVAENATKDGRGVLKPDLAKVMAAIESASDFDDLKKRLVSAYGGMKPERFAALMAKALVMAELSGRNAVLEDL